ncbi:hypothetical protein [Thomasclavelia spiroformis]
MSIGMKEENRINILNLYSNTLFTSSIGMKEEKVEFFSDLG